MRRQTRNLLAAALVVSAGLLGAVTIAAQGSSKIANGADLAPVPLNMKGLNPALVREGSYIVNAHGGCNDCHTVPSYAPGGNPFLGEPEQINAPCYLAGGAAFGPFISRNLTRVPAIRTLEQFKGGKLRDMLERAGYPGLAADYDQDVVCAIMPALEARAREMDAQPLPAEPTPNLVPR